MINELRLKQATFSLLDTKLTVQINQKSIEYFNVYSRFDFDVNTQELTAPNFKLVVNNSSDSEAIARWFESLYL